MEKGVEEIVNQMINQAEQEMESLQNEFEQMASSNKQNASVIRDSIQHKSKVFAERGQKRSKNFNFIR